MAEFKVRFARITWLTATVEADDEDAALEAAYDVLPEFTAHESGWGQHGWSADADEWIPEDEFLQNFGQEPDVPTVERVGGSDGDA